jgi:hypothetical protein
MTKEEKKIYDKQYYILNKDKINIRNKKWDYSNKEKMQIYLKKWYCDNKDNRKIKMAEWYSDNKEKVKKCQKEYYSLNKKARTESIKKWRNANKEAMEVYRKEYRKRNPMIAKNNEHRRRARMKTTDINSKWLNDLYTKASKCPLCNFEMSEDSRKYPLGKTLDHIIPLNIGGTHTKNNVRIVCAKCNCSRPKDGSDLLQLVINYKEVI